MAFARYYCFLRIVTTAVEERTRSAPISDRFIVEPVFGTVLLALAGETEEAELEESSAITAP